MRSIYVPHIHLKIRSTIFPYLTPLSGTEHENMNFHLIGEDTLVMVLQKLIDIAQYSSPKGKRNGGAKREELSSSKLLP